MDFPRFRVPDTLRLALAAFALAYADRTDEDWSALRGAIDAGRLPATEGV